MSSPGNVLELAYLEDPKVFGRDGATRRSKFRAELKAKTGEAPDLSPRVEDSQKNYRLVR